MKSEDKIVAILKELNFKGVYYGTDALDTADIYYNHLVINTITKNAILLSNEKNLIFNNYMYYITKYNVDDINRFYKRHKVKVETFTNVSSVEWRNRRNEIKRLHDLHIYTGFFDEAYFKYPEGWLTEEQFLEWLEKRKTENIPNELIKIKYNVERVGGSDYEEYVGEYKLSNGKIEVFFKMKYELIYGGFNSKYGVGEQYIIDIDPILGHMKGWTKQRLIEFCTLNNFNIERIKILEYRPYHGD